MRFTIKTIWRMSGVGSVLLLSMASPNLAVSSEKTSVPSPSPSAIPSTIPASALAPHPQSQGTSKITPVEAKVLLKEFLQAQRTEIKAIEHRGRLEIKELKASHDVRRKEWKKKEDIARHQYFADHPKGPDRRTYVKDYLQRQDALKKQLLDEQSKRNRDFDVHMSAMKQEQITRLQEFKRFLEKGERPPTTLWPRAGG